MGAEKSKDKTAKKQRCARAARWSKSPCPLLFWVEKYGVIWYNRSKYANCPSGREGNDLITKKAKLKLEFQYNSPVILTFFFLSVFVLLLDEWTNGWTTLHLFCVYRSSLKDPLFYIRLFGHVLGHADWSHFLSNMLLLLVVGPPMEEKYGSIPVLRGILFTALVTGILQCVLFPTSGLLGASGIVFMLIMLSSLAGFSGGIPITMLLVAALYFGQQVYDILFVRDNVANFMHIVGGLCGTAFGFYSAMPRRKRR